MQYFLFYVYIIIHSTLPYIMISVAIGYYQTERVAIFFFFLTNVF